MDKARKPQLREQTTETAPEGSEETVPEGRGVPEPSTSTQKWAAAARDLRQRVPAAHAKAWLAICLFLLLQMGRHPFPMLLAEPSFFILSALATFLL